MMRRAVSSSFMSSRMKTSICFAQRGTLSATAVALDRLSVAECERQIVEPVLGDGGRMGEPGPATIGIEEELPIDELEHAALLGLDGHFGVTTCSREQRVLAARVQFQNPREPGFEPAIVEVAIGDLAAGLIVERLQVEHQCLGERHRIPEAREPERCDARRGRQVFCGRPRRRALAFSPICAASPRASSARTPRGTAAIGRCDIVSKFLPVQVEKRRGTDQHE